MECPVCHKIQLEDSSAECQFCGLIFEKWRAKQEFKTPAEKFHALLEVSSSEILAYRVDAETRTLFGLLLFFVDPSIKLILPLLPSSNFFSPYPLLSVVCFVAGILIGMIADKRGFSGILTAGGAGLFGGVLRFFGLCVLLPGTFSERVFASLPTFGIYALIPFLGGGLSWVFKKFLKITL